MPAGKWPPGSLPGSSGSGSSSYLSAATISSAQPARNASPPSGVTIPGSRDARQCQRIETAGEQHDTERKQPASGTQQAVIEEAERDGGDDDRQCVVHLVADPGFEGGEHLGREASAQAVRAKRAKPDADEAGHCTTMRSTRSMAMIVSARRLKVESGKGRLR